MDAALTPITGPAVRFAYTNEALEVTGKGKGTG